MRFSTIIAARNCQDSIQTCIDSIISQNCGDLQIIIVENGSEDRTLELVKKIAKQHPEVEVYTSDVVGVSNARNIGLQHANGDIITFCDADDYLLPASFRKVEDIFSKNDVQMVCTGILIKNKSLSLPQNNEKDEIVSSSKMMEYILCNPSSMGSLCNKFFKKALISNMSLKTELTYLEDGFFNVELLAKNRGIEAYVSTFISYCYVIHEGSATNDYSKLFDENSNYKYLISLNKMLSELPLSYQEKRYVKDDIFRVAVGAMWNQNIKKTPLQEEKLFEAIQSSIFTFIPRVFKFDYQKRITFMKRGIRLLLQAKKGMRSKVVIYEGYRWKYFQWFILGLYELKKQGKIRLKFDLPLGSKILSLTSEKHLVDRAEKKMKKFENDSYNMSGYIDFSNKEGKRERKFFTIDAADAPYLFDSKKLEKVDAYFKMQCPKSLDEKGFKLTDTITIPWLDHEHVDPKLKKLTDRGERKLCASFSKNVNKIKPLMIGPRALSPKSFSYRHLKEGYDNYLKEQKTYKSKNIMCYFGNSQGPRPEENVIRPDYDWEADISGYYKEQISHPNEKRAIIADMINQKKGCDGRLISRGNADTGLRQRADLVVPLNQFCGFISEFQWNVNVSGYRLSIPNRFIESFMVGTSIITDRLAVKWYLPFGEEVYESTAMGYLPMDQVDWKKFDDDINHLPEAHPSQVIKSFQEKWAPIVVAKYILNTVIGKK